MVALTPSLPSPPPPSLPIPPELHPGLPLSLTYPKPLSLPLPSSLPTSLLRPSTHPITALLTKHDEEREVKYLTDPEANKTILNTHLTP